MCPFIFLFIFLHSNEKRGNVRTVTLPGDEFQGWVLAERASEFERFQSTLEGRFKDNEIIFSELRAASEPLPTTEVIRRVARAAGHPLTKKAFGSIECRVRACLRYHRIEGTITAVWVPGSKGQSWVLTERVAELCPLVRATAKSRRGDDQIETVLRTAGKPITALDAARRLRSVLPRSQRRGVALVTLRNRVYSYLRAKRQRGEVRIVLVRGKKGQCWELLGSSDKASRTGG